MHFHACSLRDIKNDLCSFWILRVGSDHWSELYVAGWVIFASSTLEFFYRWFTS